MVTRFFFVLLVMSNSLQTFSQHYSAIHGSQYAGSLGVTSNPASIVSTPYKWDLTLFGFQYQTITNAVRGRNMPSILMKPDSKFSAAQGNYERKADLNFNMRLLNARISLDQTHAIAFGFNVRGYGQVKTSQVNYTDSVLGPRSFLFLNAQNPILSAKLASSAWMEVYGTYGLTFWDRETDRLNAAVTIKLMKGVSGAFARLGNVGVTSSVVNDRNIFRIENGNARYGYSANYDGWINNTGTPFSLSNFLKGGGTGLSVDLGVEYLIKSQGVTSFNNYSDEDNDYEWKIGVSLMDLGWNTYKYSTDSRDVSSLKSDITADVLLTKFSSIKNISGFNDSLATIVENSETLQGKFTIMNPARLTINADRYVSANFYVNGELSLNLSPLIARNKLYVTESGLLTVTPRWETKSLGLYLPIQYTNSGNFWIGGALKAGPLLIGTHNLLNAFAKNKNISGGGYIALIIRPSQLIRESRNQQYECPVF